MARDNSVSTESISVPLRVLVGACIALISLLGAVAAATWSAAGALHRIDDRIASIEARIETVQADMPREYVTRVEASRYHRDLERVLRSAGVQVDFPPPDDPGLGFSASPAPRGRPP